LALQVIPDATHKAGVLGEIVANSILSSKREEGQRHRLKVEIEDPSPLEE